MEGTALSGKSGCGECCAVRSGVFENKFYDPTAYRLGTYAFSPGAGQGLGTRRPMTRSEEQWRKALRVIPAGTQTLSKGPGCFVDGVSPKYLARGKGSHVWDVDGNEYIDYCLACFPLTLGYSVPAVDEAIKAQLSDGITFSMMHPLEVKVADMLTERIPCAEMARFGKNGSDVTAMAVRLARHITGRDKVACLGYHGMQDWFIGTTDRSWGIPEAVRKMTIPFRYNDPASLEDIFSKHKGEVACVIMEPAMYEFPVGGFLDAVREMTAEEGALLIFDEMLTGFRFAEGGAQELFGVTPDLATFGKGIANGMPIGVLVGREQYMRHFEKVFFSSTYGGEVLTLAAAAAALNFYREHRVIRQLWKAGKIIFDNFNRLVRDRGLSDHVQTVGFPVRQQMIFRDRTGEISYILPALFQQEMLKRGILCYAGLGFSYSHSDEDLMVTVRAFQETLDVLEKAIESGQPERFMEGVPSQPVFRNLRAQKQTAN